MSSPEAALIAALTADAGVSALVGSRVFVWGGRQGTAYPYVTVQRISTAGAEYLNGPNTLEWPRLQLDIWAGTVLDALNVGEAIRSAIDSIELTAAGLTFTATFQDQRGPTPDETTRTFGVSQDYFVFHSR